MSHKIQTSSSAVHTAHPLSPEQAWRDLAWVVTGPSLVARLGDATVVPSQADAASRAWLARQRQDPGALLDHLAQRDTRLLGSYFEALWEYALSRYPHVEVIARRQQIHHQGTTLGEFDLLLYDHVRQRHIHQELAVKFYLGLPVAPGASRQAPQASVWLGPNARDRLDLKLARLATHQLRLSQHPVAGAWLQRQGVVDLDVEAVLRGYLFHPWGHASIPPTNVSLEHGQGRWLHVAQLTAIASAGERWRILAKPCWLAPTQASWEDTLAFEELRARMTEPRRTDAQLIAALCPQGGQWCEVERFFVVSDDWPDGPKR